MSVAVGEAPENNDKLRSYDMKFIMLGSQCLRAHKLFHSLDDNPFCGRRQVQGVTGRVVAIEFQAACREATLVVLDEAT